MLCNIYQHLLHSMRGLPRNLHGVQQLKLGLVHVDMAMQRGPLAPLCDNGQDLLGGHIPQKQEYIDMPRFPQQRHLVSKGQNLLRTRILDVQGLDRDGAVPISAIHSAKGTHPNVLLVKQNVRSRDLPVLDGLLVHDFDLLVGGLVS